MRRQRRYGNGVMYIQYCNIVEFVVVN